MALNHEEIKKDPQRILKIKLFINKQIEKEQIVHHNQMIGKNVKKII